MAFSWHSYEQFTRLCPDPWNLNKAAVVTRAATTIEADLRRRTSSSSRTQQELDLQQHHTASVTLWEWLISGLTPLRKVHLCLRHQSKDSFDCISYMKPTTSQPFPSLIAISIKKDMYIHFRGNNNSNTIIQSTAPSRYQTPSRHTFPDHKHWCSRNPRMDVHTASLASFSCPVHNTYTIPISKQMSF